MEIPEDPLYLKVAALITLLGIAVFGGAVPIYWKRLRDSPLALSHLNAFSAGVFISMAFNHLLPDADEAFRSLGLSFKQIAFTLAMSGYAFILWIEKCVVDAHALVHEHTETGHCDEHHLSDQVSSANSPTLAIFAVAATSAHCAEVHSQPDSIDNDGGLTCMSIFCPISSSSITQDGLVAPDSPMALSHPSTRRRILSHASLLPGQVSENGVGEEDATGNYHDVYVMSATRSGSIEYNDSPNIAHLGQNFSDPAPRQSPADADSGVITMVETLLNTDTSIKSGWCSMSTTSFVLMSALCVHALLEGIALGLQSSANHVITLAIGLLAHKWVEAVALATSFIKSKRSQSASLLFIGMFACATPFGILIGILLSFTRSVAVEATFTAVAAGTFVYVGCNEVVAEEFEDRKHRGTKFACLAFGMTIIAFLTSLNLDSD